MGRQPPTDRASLSKPRTVWAWAVGTIFGIGLLRPGPGTFGSIAAVVAWLSVIHATHASPHAQTIGTAVAAVIVTVLGIPAATLVARESGREDPGHIVIDEVAGQLIALLVSRPDWPHALLALLLFRLFDIFKPPPIRQLERLPGGSGIMLDDVAAGFFALIAGMLASLSYHGFVR